ncbi:NDP-sugar epimerase, includes UDP-GlcNAc-inverting 4,6-dehydratase FlaA1 and capsular polysaccharide biosynthesis protein EpsC [Formivibrio citricus]|uniref:NDP-sugar epimerase, includes UDP-GlcNAc-inverting 4,6-dehydratase FlaA1 and capsular polysaccharide biosynthesis protein EpsC n=1 Tax=Formivibrio citricus TaxID=83765 RepID=A0A1I4XXH6_9NEIS|nr:nucleoside-diphosphate sugar epimerase/dehydratase [Formivibrio citricus]SFN30544.1 NDP-sugar epimerase, includes UDP-GlcNAc-inverting 4,6-dehydratase FlaA1 and capsular polysaccharide biosynthesis protein EpsC [Formivibrio citricus]
MKFISRSTLVFLFDNWVAVAAWLGGFWLRFNFSWDAAYSMTILYGLVWLWPVHAMVCRIAGLYRGLWGFASLPDLQRVLKAVLGSTVALLVFMSIFQSAPPVPRSMLVLYPLLMAFLMGGGRLGYRMWKEHRLFGGMRRQGKPVIVIGAGRAATLLIRELERSPDWKLVGLLDDDSAKWGRDLGGYRVLGGIELLPDIAEELQVQHVILAIPSAPSEVKRKVADLGGSVGLHLLTVPGLEDIMSGRVSVHQIRKVEIEDLLGRDSVKIDTDHVGKLLEGKVVLVTGAGGSIGSELCRQLAGFAPACIVLFEQTEYALYMIEQWFNQYRPETRVIPLAGDVKDVRRLEDVFKQYQPQVVFHAAAYKHVPLMEVGNAWQAVRNNVLGTLNVARVAQQHGAERFVLISTDKAVNPTNVMGATKRLAEMMCQSLHAQHDGMKIEVVRFGNVLGSAGSVIPKFQEQIARGGPVTVTHPDITRYFMSIPEAALLVLQASAMGEGGEIFVLDMGEPVRIADLARNMVRLSGFTEDQIRIEYTGLRPGEKLYEELLADAEHTRATPHPKLRIAKAREVEPAAAAEIEAWISLPGTSPDEDVRAGLKKWVPEYQPA